jgi:hypothetical protein
LFPDRWLLPIVGCTDTVRYIYHIALATSTLESFALYCRDGYRRRLITKATHVTLCLPAALTVPVSALANATSAGSEAPYITNMKKPVKIDHQKSYLALDTRTQSTCPDLYIDTWIRRSARSAFLLFDPRDASPASFGVISYTRTWILCQKPLPAITKLCRTREVT